ncbi:MAG: HAMP domain-containing histidine kinase [Anaerolineales bacterium]|nr:HAMP domain-containing histidine kinase [Anaerolineales bacterium]
MKKIFSIRVYLILSHALLLIISLGSIGFIWSRNEYHVITQELQKLMRERITLIANIIGHELTEHNEVKLEQMEFPQLYLEENMLTVYIDNLGEIHDLIPGSVSPREADLFMELNSQYAVTDGSYTMLVSSETEVTNIYAASPVFYKEDQRIGVVCLLMPIGQIDRYIVRLRWLLMGAILMVALLGVGVSTLLTNYFSLHFSRARALAATVANGNYGVRIPESGPAELRDLSHYLNQMAEKLQDQLKMRQVLLANVAHELARPLAGLQLGIESLRNGAINDPELADDLLVGMRQTIRQFESLLDDITLSAQSETQRPIKLKLTAIAVKPFLQGIGTRYWTVAESRGIKLEIQVGDGVSTVRADEKRINQIVGNLIDNAIKFTPRGKTVRLSAEKGDDGNIRILVHDGGKGIPPEEARHVFEPFYQGDVGRRIKQGMGLGLAIARQLTNAHGGSLILRNHPDGGAVAILTLPTGIP